MFSDIRKYFRKLFGLKTYSIFAINWWIDDIPTNRWDLFAFKMYMGSAVQVPACRYRHDDLLGGEKIVRSSCLRSTWKWEHRSVLCLCVMCRNSGWLADNGVEKEDKWSKSQKRQTNFICPYCKYTLPQHSLH